ncbi:hypothetical protein [Streptomyces collinus]|uniref:Serine/threonine protein kinase n=1 Tax=Streptomyces collinus (strain DSM 40733 / Tue 365) TaxID=1214242 RepID=S5V4Q5_STRC3|nr:hypothetical protein [Streptomyces collinus]AGS72731.1 hypothetical protein B446_29625 [Streptomyces collinus Tu 365]UJA11392.1 hypothetical protein HGI10_53690 [Streptomyces collinus]UJA13742.1 hypothetical protein HGI09_10410 [Streptomyces collinus]
MTTATAVAGRPLSGWSRETPLGTRYALLPGRAGEQALGALRVDRALLAPEGARERLAAAVLATARLRLPGALGTVDLVAEAGEVWLLTDRPPAPTLADVLSAGAPGPDAGSAASVLNETAQTLLALHGAGLAHGSLGPATVVLAPNGTALLTETGLAAVLGDEVMPGDAAPPPAGHRAADTTAWAALARTLAAAWTGPSTPAAELFARCATAAESQGLMAARAALLSGRAALPTDFLQRTALRAAAAASTPDLTSPRTPRPGPAAEPPDRTSPRTAQPCPAAEPPELPHVPSARTPRTPPAAASPRPPHPTGPRRTPVPSVVAGTAHTGSVADTAPAPPTKDRAAEPAAPGDRTPPGAPSQRATPAAVPADADADADADAAERLTGAGHGQGHRPVRQDAQATVLGKRNRPSSVRVRDGEEPGEILLRFGPGVPVAEQDALRARWRGAEAVPAPARRRRRGGGLVIVAVAAVAAVLLWLLLRPDPAPGVLAVRVQAPAGVLHCGGTADLVGVVTTDGRGGPVTYRWLRGDGQDSGELVHLARRGERRVRVHLRWTVRGPGRFRGTARLRVADRRSPVEAKGGFTYACP